MNHLGCRIDDFSNNCIRFREKVTSKMANAEVLNRAATTLEGIFVHVTECNNNNNNNDTLYGQNNKPCAFYTLRNNTFPKY